MIEMSPGEVIDRYTILRMKAKIDKSMIPELEKYEKEFNEIIHIVCKKLCEKPEDKNINIFIFNSFWSPILTIMENNAKIWTLEASIRLSYSNDPNSVDKLSLEEIGKRALRIRDLNKFRVNAKNMIDCYFGFNPDKKIDHASTDDVAKGNI